VRPRRRDKVNPEELQEYRDGLTELDTTGNWINRYGGEDVAALIALIDDWTTRAADPEFDVLDLVRDVAPFAPEGE